MQKLYKLSEDYLELIGPAINTKLEIDFLDKIFKKYKVKNILDVACGVGRHTISLAKKGYNVRGIDFSPYQIRKAKKEAKREGIKTEFMQKNANDFLFSKKFDAAICMWSTIGEEPMQFTKVIKNVFSSLKSGGIFIIDNRSWADIPKGGERTIRYSAKMKNGKVVKVRMNDQYTENFRVRNVFYKIGGKKFKDLCITHTLEEEEWIKEFKIAGFKKFKVYYDYKSKKIKKPKRFIIIATK
jgi:SAM-dependent methyltransferase